MNKLSVDPAAEQKFVELTEKYSDALLARADIIARQRKGNTIQTGDLESAEVRMLRTDRNTQILVLIAGAALGAGVGGLIQSPLDGKPFVQIATYGGVSVAALVAAVVALWRR